MATHLEYALLLSSTGHDEEARAMLTPYASGATVVPGALRTLVSSICNSDLDSASKRFDALLSTGAQTYESLFHLGAIAERREDTDRALRNYTRVTGGDFLALPAQVRVARIKVISPAPRPACCIWRSSHARARSSRSTPTCSAPRCSPSVTTSAARWRSSTPESNATPDSVDLRMARVFLLERTDRVDASVREPATAAQGAPGWRRIIQNALGSTLADRTREYDEAL